GLEPHLLAFETVERGLDRGEEKLFLHTSPEYAMKRLLGRGHGMIYQLARVFRNGERSRTHTPAFPMLEWYRAPGALTTIMDDTEALVREIAGAIAGPWRPWAFERLTVSQAFLRAGLADPIPVENAIELQQALGVRAVAGDSWEDVFHRAMLDQVERTFSR